MKFIVVGENIHCTRILKKGGKKVFQAPDGRWVIGFGSAGKQQVMPVPEPFLAGADWAADKVKHCAAAIWQGLYGKGEDRQAGADYIAALAREQEQAGASFLDLNVDEFSTDLDERLKALAWAADVVQKASRLPLSIDSSNEVLMRAGLDACDKGRGRPMLNSVSLERIGLVSLAAERKPAVVVSAAGESGLPCTVEERVANVEKLMPRLDAAGLDHDWIYVDPLVYTISTDPNNGRIFLDAVSEIRRRFGPRLHIIGGLSNISFGMPSRKLINQVFSRLVVEAGGDGGIVDPLQINAGILDALDFNSEGFRLAKALLMGEDEFGMAFITAARDGRI